jgi:hypothetical protein
MWGKNFFFGVVCLALAGLIYSEQSRPTTRLCGKIQVVESLKKKNLYLTQLNTLQGPRELLSVEFIDNKLKSKLIEKSLEKDGEDQKEYCFSGIRDKVFFTGKKRDQFLATSLDEG